MDTSILYDQKWQRLLTRSFFFRSFPFVDFALAAGSLALGDVHFHSDFDVIVGARAGRLYTARFFCLSIYKLLRWRKNQNKTDGFCFNHFVTEQSYRLQPPYNLYWQELYRHLVPVFGDTKKIVQFFAANGGWIFSPISVIPNLIGDPLNSHSGMDSRVRGNDNGGMITAIPRDGELENDLHFRYQTSSALKLFLERLLAGRAGDWLETVFKKYQMRKIEKNLRRFPPGYQPRIIYTDDEVEMHLDTRRLETVKNKRYFS